MFLLLRERCLFATYYDSNVVILPNNDDNMMTIKRFVSGVKLGKVV
jgi:hypothetical protein